LRGSSGNSATRGRLAGIALAVAGALMLLPAGARATPPALVAVGQSGGKVTATWTIPPGMAMDFIEAGNSPAVNPDGGDFPLKNTVLAESLGDFQTTYTATVPIAAGTYYVHVSAFDTKKCVTGNEPDCVDEWSSMLTVPVPAGVDKLTDFSFLGASSPQRIGKLFVVASMPEQGTITASATVSVPKASKVYRFKTVSASVVPGVRVKLRLRLPKKSLKVVRRALKHHRKLKAKVTVTARDASGNTRSAKGTIRLKL
jgi:hypothetical protein